MSDYTYDEINAVHEFAWNVHDSQGEGWDEGHRHSWRRGPDDCQCGAYYAGECACGEYGCGPLLSLADNPYRADEIEGK